MSDIDLKEFYNKNVRGVVFDYIIQPGKRTPWHLSLDHFKAGVESGHITLLGQGEFIYPAFYGFKDRKYYCYDKGNVDQLKTLIKIKFSLVDNGDALITKEKIEIRNDINELEKELPNVMTEKGKYAIATTINALEKYLIDIIPKVPPKKDLLWLFKGNKEALELFRKICQHKGLTEGGLWKKSITYLRKTNKVLLEAGIVRNAKNDELLLRIYSFEFNKGEKIVSQGKYLKPEFGNERPELIKEIKEIFASLIEKFGTENHS